MFRNMLDYDNSTLERLSIDGRDYKAEHCHLVPDIVFGLSFGLNRDRSSVNYGLAQSILDIRTHFQEDIPAIVQDRMVPCLEDLSVGNFYRVGKDSDYSWRLDSHDILALSIEKAQGERLSLKRVLYVAHPAHVQRVRDCGARIGLVGVPFVSGNVQWSENDEEKWVRTAHRWFFREIVARAIYKVKRYT
jgi:hypothetical protein